MDLKELLKDEIKITEVVARLGLELSRRGNTWQGNCPSGHPSQGEKCFSVNVKGNYFNCFSCGKGGDIFSLVELDQGLEFKAAIRWITETFKPELLPELDRWKGDLSPEQEERYQKAGLLELKFERGRGLLYRDRRGLITGFIKRATAPKGIDVKTYDGKEHTGVRWDSTPGTSKGDIFNLCNTRGEEELLLLEGYPDALYLPTLGLKNVVALGQGAFSQEYMKGLQAHGVKRVIIALDNDGEEKGLKRTEEALDTFLKSNIRPFVIDPPLLSPYKDPDELVKGAGIGALQELLRTAQSGVKWKAKRIINRHDILTDIGRQRAIDETLELEDGLLDPLDSKDVIDILTDTLQIPYELLEPKLLDYHEKKNQERLKKEYQDLFRKGQALLTEGKLDELKTYLDDKNRELKAQTGARNLEPYGMADLTRDISETQEGLLTGWHYLDLLLRIPQEAITIIAGRPSHGKTTLLLNLFLNMIKTYPDQSFFFFSYEETRKQIALKLLNILSGDIIDEKQNLSQLENYLRGENTNNQKIETAKEKLNTLTRSGRLWIIDQALYVDELGETLAHLNSRHNIGAVFVDYIQKIKIREKYGTRQLELQAISERILEAAKDLSLPLLLGAQLGRDKGSKDKVRLDNLREAGDIEQDANLVLGIYNSSMEKAQADGEKLTKREVELELTILKNRGGIVNEGVKLNFDRPLLRISDNSKQGGRPW